MTDFLEQIENTQGGGTMPVFAWTERLGSTKIKLVVRRAYVGE